MSDAATLDAIEQALEALMNIEGKESALLAEELVQKLETALLGQQQMDAELVQPKLKVLLKKPSLDGARADWADSGGHRKRER